MAETDDIVSQRLMPEDTTIENFSISLDVDETTAVVGAYADRDDDFFGEVYIFTRSCYNKKWILQQKLIAPVDIGEGFGQGLSLDGDTLVTNGGYVFIRSDNTWTLQQKLTLPNGEELFGGFSLSLDRDTVVIGSYWDDENGEYSGSAYVFTRTSGVWILQQKLTPDAGDAWDMFGHSVSLDGDTIVIGSPNDNERGGHSGSAYVFIRTNGIWSLQQKIIPDDTGTRDFFGTFVSIDKDTAIIGDTSYNKTYSSYIFSRYGNLWSQTLKIFNTGCFLSLDMDTAVIASPEYPEYNVYKNNGSLWTLQRNIRPVDTTGSDNLRSLAISNTVSIDGDTILLTCPDGSCDDALAYIYSKKKLCKDNSDGDKIPDNDDKCHGTSSGDVINSSGCSIIQTCPCNNNWKNRGKYMQCVQKASRKFLTANLITKKEWLKVNKAAVKSKCGQRELNSIMISPKK